MSGVEIPPTRSRAEIWNSSRPAFLLLLFVAASCALLIAAFPVRGAIPVASVSPSAVVAGGPATPIAVTVSTAELAAADAALGPEITAFAILWGVETLPATKVVGPEVTTFSATITAKQLAIGATNVKVQAANCFADGSCEPLSEGVGFAVTAAPAPALAAISPAKIAAGGPGFRLTLVGTGFSPSSVAVIGGAARPTAFVDRTRLTTEVAAGEIATRGTLKVKIRNPKVLGGAGNVIGLKVTKSTVAPRPTLSSLAPDSASAGSAAIDLTVRGTGFDPGSRVRFAGAARKTSFVSPSELVARIPAAALAAAGPQEVSVLRSVGGRSGTGTFLVIARPEILSLSPGTITTGGAAYTLTITGTGFDAASTVQLDGVDVPTSRTGGGELTALVGPSLITTPGAIAVRVVNPAAAGGAGAPVTLVVQLEPQPVVAAIPSEPPEISEVGAEALLPGEVLSIAGMHFGREQGDATIRVGDEEAELAGEWGDAQIDVRVPDLPPGPATIVLTTVVGEATAEIVIGDEPEAPPIANPVLLPASNGRITFDASIALDPATGAGAAGDAQSNALGLTGIAEILWRFGDGGTSTATRPTRAYTKPGVYTPTVTVTTDDGRRSTVSAGTVRVRRAPSGRLVAKPPPVNFSVPSRVVFDAGDSSLRPESRPYLLRLSSLVKKVGRRTEIGGHSDGSGAFDVNQRLSEERARAVRDFLITQGSVPQGLLTAVGYGETRPIAENDTALGRQRNRRVELSIERGNTPIRLTSRQLLINQRISQAAIARATALEKRLIGGLRTQDIRDGSLMPQDFGPSVTVSGEPALDDSPRAGAPRLSVRTPKRSNKKLSVSKKQLLINQRISQAAVRRVNRLDEVLEAGLTGAAIRNGAITADDLAPSLSALPGSDAPAQGRFVLPALRIASVSTGRVRATQEQLIINQRVSQAAIRRLNLAIKRFEKGLTGADFRDGSLSSADLDR